MVSVAAHFTANYKPARNFVAIGTCNCPSFTGNRVFADLGRMPQDFAVTCEASASHNWQTFKLDDPLAFMDGKRTTKTSLRLELSKWMSFTIIRPAPGSIPQTRYNLRSSEPGRWTHVQTPLPTTPPNHPGSTDGEVDEEIISPGAQEGRVEIGVAGPNSEHIANEGQRRPLFSWRALKDFVRCWGQQLLGGGSVRTEAWFDDGEQRQELVLFAREGNGIGTWVPEALKNILVIGVSFGAGFLSFLFMDRSDVGAGLMAQPSPSNITATVPAFAAASGQVARRALYEIQRLGRYPPC